MLRVEFQYDPKNGVLRVSNGQEKVHCNIYSATYYMLATLYDNGMASVFAGRLYRLWTKHLNKSVIWQIDPDMIQAQLERAKDLTFYRPGCNAHQMLMAGANQ